MKELDGGAFQKLADSYLKKKGYEYLIPLGSVIGANKVKKGTPDSLVIIPNGKYVLVEYTTQPTGLAAKLTSDINKCFDEIKTGIPVAKIDEIVICCHTSNLNAGEYYQLREHCKAHNVNLNIFGIDTISYDLLEKYPGIARNYLGINVDTGQIIPPDEFINLYSKNKFATRLDTNFLFRDDETNNIRYALENNNLVIVQGKAGVGKTRVALECCVRFTEIHSEYKTFCIFNRGPDIFDDIKTHFSEPGSFLILVDDANRVSKFEYLVQQLQYKREDQQIKIIVTVRDYAIEHILKASKAYSEAPEIIIRSFTDEQIKQLVGNEYNIQNYHYLKRIANIAKGNPRLAIMAAEVVKEKSTLESINNVSNLYDSYFASIHRDLDEIDDLCLLKIAGIVAFFRILDRKNETIMSAIESAFGLTTKEIWEAVNQLHNIEIIDVYENEIAKISDQVLATYLFYLCFLKKNGLDFGILLEKFYPKYRERLIDALNPVMNIFHNEDLVKAVRSHVDTFWSKISEDNREDFLFLLNDFGLLKQTETLIYIKNRIDALPKIQINVADLDFEAKSKDSLPSFFTILRSFRNAEDDSFRIALDLLCDYLEKCPDKLPEFLDLFSHHFCFHHTSYLYVYSVQQGVIDTLWKRTQQGQNLLFSKIFLIVAKAYTPTEFHNSESSDAHTINYINFELTPSIYLTRLRKSMWAGILHLYKINTFKDEVIEALYSYIKNHKVSVSEIIEQDAYAIIPFITQELSPKKFKHCFLVQAYLRKLEARKIPFDNSLKEQFKSKTYCLYDFLTTDWLERNGLELNYEDYEIYKENEIEKYTSQYNLEDYIQFIELCTEIKSSIPQSIQLHSFDGNIITAIVALTKRSGDLYSKVMEHYLEQRDPLNFSNFHHQLLVKNLIEVAGTRKTYLMLDKANHKNKRAWLFNYYEHLPTSDISSRQLSQLYELYKNAELRELPNNWDYLLDYQAIETEVISKITEIIVIKSKTNIEYAKSLFNLFSPLTKVNKKITIHFTGKMELLKQAYFMWLGTYRNGDHEGSNFDLFLNQDSNFIIEYIDWIYKKKKWVSRHDDHRNYSFIWKRDNHHEIMIKAAERIFQHEKDDDFYSFFHVFFGLKEENQELQEITTCKKNFLMKLIEDKHSNVKFMKFVFSLVSILSEDDRRTLISKYINFNNNFTDFEQLPLESSSQSWSGSAVPMLQHRADFFQTLVPLFNTASLLEHKFYIEQKIKHIRSEIEREMKRDFIDG